MARASVKVDSGPVSATDTLRYVPKERWHDLMLARRHFAEVNVSYDCRCLVQFVNEAKQMFKALGFASVEGMIRDGYGLEPEEVGIAVRWLELNPPNEPVPMDAAVRLGKHGGDRRSEEYKDQVGTPHLKGNGSKERTIAKLEEKKLWDLAKQVRSGAKTAQAACHEAGFRTKLSKCEQIKKWIPGLTEEERQEIREMLT